MDGLLVATVIRLVVDVSWEYPEAWYVDAVGESADVAAEARYEHGGEGSL